MIVSKEAPDPHCVVWAQVYASLWGMASDHHLDEPVRLTDEVPVRLRLKHGKWLMIDRDLNLKTYRSATHTALRLYFRNGSFTEIDLIGVPHVSPRETVNITGVSVGE